MTSEALDIYSLIGFLGTACIIGAYAYLTYRDDPNPYILHGTNLMGAALLTISLLVHTNWPSLVLEGFWAAIAIFGLVKAGRRRTKTVETPS
ncbi:permease [Erythrobacter sp. JK5]|uniref:CBU_0592 family membrane protein n=1 Tax=Erythrobacter sp. JK5 TaxID=2829500 RepID=UPI001BA95B39|nr:permease [Erythrobacter sp. JK5]QUL38491.1 permease [Erythrobacter sp. JK5]